MLYKERVLGSLLFVILIAVDLLSKVYFIDLLGNQGNSITVFESKPISMYWTLLYNSGVSFSAFNNNPFLVKVVFSGFAFIIGIWGFILCIKNPKFDTIHQKLYYCVALFIGTGALGNAIDRLYNGHVTDFIHFKFGGTWSFAIFNVADIYITLAVICFILTLFIKPKDDGYITEESLSKF